MEKEKFQIGWFTVAEDKVYRNTFSYAAWYEDVLVKAGKYPVWARHYSYNERLKKYESDLKDFGNICVILPGIVQSDDFTTHYGGMPIGDKSNVNTGKESEYYWHPYAHAVAHNVLEGNSPYELIEPFKAVYVDFTDYNGKPCRTADIINTEKE